MVYKLTNSTSILRSDGAYIPADPANRDYAEYLTWLSAGNQPEPADTPAAPTYAELRAAAYPSIPDQLDLIYHDFEAWREKIAAVKAQYPKE